MRLTQTSKIFAGLTALLLAMPAMAQEAENPAHDHGHDHSHNHDHGHGHEHAHSTEASDKSEKSAAIYKGYFEDSEVAERPLSDWEGQWQSVYPLLQNGALDPVMQAKAKSGDRTAEDYAAYYETGYRTEVTAIEIAGDLVTFTDASGPISAHYVADGFEILTYEKGNRGVRFIFRKAEGDYKAPGYIQFSDHAIAPVKAGHYHLYWGDDRAALLKEVTHWPTYYPAALSADEIVAEMLAH